MAVFADIGWAADPAPAVIGRCLWCPPLSAVPTESRSAGAMARAASWRHSAGTGCSCHGPTGTDAG